ncbi:NADH-dependent alcohol dehydrogenase [Capsulimonas corticalis]|uniref:NADH-dependent alcohol dehydrogenase n=1 Tax=Capsulimonas corticalis TaxID=2219043 RepID=A0A402D0I5_9BACT|nr:iron-containing alcohol dehydrogenase [Capsulimonas corticalis]BDI33589.1 NADH-dependent alcohol dehydrogenase [Capsulimonas corticalis]
MNSFAIYTPTRIFFGPDQRASFAESAARLGKHAFVVTGGGSVERLGYLKHVTDALTAAGVTISYFSGVEPNPEAATINRAAAQLKAAGADFVVAVGGGSVMDAAKGIAALAYTGEEDIWPFVIGESRAFQLGGAIPIAAVPTTTATASEVTPFAVISNRAARGKSILIAEFLKPQAAWLNPEYTTGLSPVTTQDGAADILSHIFESYLLGGNESPLADRYSEGVIHTVIETLPRVLENPADTAARGDLFWASTLALNDYQKAGRSESQFVLHAIEHALSAHQPSLAHGRGLATLYPAYLRWLLVNGRAQDRIAQLGERIFGLTGTEQERAGGFIARFEDWLAANGLLQSLEELGFHESDYASIANYAVTTYGDGRELDALGSLPASEIVAIFQATASQGKTLAAA